MAEPVRQSSFHREVAGRFGIVPNFFTSSSDAPEVMEKLWEFAKSAYLDSPIPPLFKERLFVFLSRFCEVRYCIVRHCGFLVGHGHVAGDSAAPPHTVAQAIKLLKMPTPWRRPIEAVYQGLEEIEHVPTDWPEPDSDVEDWIFAAAAVTFVTPTQSERARHALRKVLVPNALNNCWHISPSSGPLTTGPSFIPV